MSVLISCLHWLAGFVVVAEALNKCYRTSPLAPGMTWHERLVDGLKALAWALLCIGGAGAMATPLLLPDGPLGPFVVPMFRMERPTLQDACVLVGFAVLIVRTRVKEG